MSRFVLLYTGDGIPETEAEQAAVMAAWTAWYGNMGDAIVDAGAPFTPAAKTITSKGVSDGAISSPAATGYTIITADSLDAAVAAVGDHPHFNAGGQVTVYETFNM